MAINTEDSNLADMNSALEKIRKDARLDFDIDLGIIIRAAAAVGATTPEGVPRWTQPEAEEIFLDSDEFDWIPDDLLELAHTVRELKEQLEVATVAAQWMLNAEERHLHPTAKGLDDESLGWYVKSAAAAARSFINRRDLSESR